MKTTYPDQPAKDFNEWQNHIQKSAEELAVEKFEKDFNKAWNNFKSSVVRARTKQK